jgi:signal transduction histidine kinase
MKKLKNKIFLTILLILTISVLSIITIFTIQNYLEQKNNIESNLNMALDNAKNSKNNDEFKNDKIEENDFTEPNDNKEKIKFVDSTIYTILIDKNNNIKEIINHSNNELQDSDIKDIANDILNQKNIKEKHIGFLYFEKYSYVYLKDNSLVIFDNENIKNNLVKSLEISSFIFIIIELIFIFISNIISNWIINPVKISFEKQKQFIADASHELKTPLSVIIASTEALEENIKENKWIKNIKSETERMNLLIKDLLNLASSERNNITLETKNLSKIIELSILTFEGITFENNIKLNYKIEEDIKLMVDENSIKQLIEILLDNAIKHSKKNGVINVVLENNINYVQLLVENEGDEIPKGEEEKIFERFYRVDKSRNRKENRYGLGLAIAKNIVLNHNGKITAHSNNGKTTFKILFKK